VLLVVVGPVGLASTNNIATIMVKPEAATAVVELLMMSVRTPETR